MQVCCSSRFVHAIVSAESETAHALGEAKFLKSITNKALRGSPQKVRR